MIKYFSFLFLFFFISCGSGTTDSILGSPLWVAVDSTNDRLFVLEKESVFFAFTASTQETLGDQPLVDDETETTIHTLLPSAPTGMVVTDVSGISRLFITGAQDDENGNALLNDVLVLDFDGTTITEASFSPIVVEDDDATTDDTDDILGGLKVDADNNRLYVTNATTGSLFTYSLIDGSIGATTLAIAGAPNKMSLDGNRLYVANSTDTSADQLITVVNTDDFTTTTVDLGIPTDDISVLSNNTGTVLLAKHSGEQLVMVMSVDTGTFADALAISNGDETVSDGAISPTAGITSAVGSVLLAKDSEEAFYGYAPQADGNIEILTIESDLSSFTGSANETSTSLLKGMDVLVDSSGVGEIVYMAASGTSDVLFVEVGSTDLDVLF